MADERKCRRAVNSRLHTRIELTRIGRRRTRQDAPIPPEKFDEGQTNEADVFLAARKGPVFGPFSVLGRSRELILPYRIQGDYRASIFRSAPSFPITARVRPSPSRI